MKKKHILILTATLFIGIVIGALSMGIYSHKRMNIYSEIPPVEDIKRRYIKTIEPDATQLNTIGPILDRYSANAYNTMKESQTKMYLLNEYLYNELKPILNETQKEKFEKRINRIKTRIGK
ncbi:MAG: hypothetical protein LWX07_12875 [Bacteroidetes bacterium]|nr:hypothetical protein [Bacteroidota bacterium]